MSDNSRRDFMRKLGLGVAGIGGMSLLGRAASAASALDGKRSMIDRLVSPSQSSALLRDNGQGFYTIRAQGMPNHATGTFPNSGCPGPLLAQNLMLKVAKEPKYTSKLQPLNGWLFGVAINGVVMDPTGPYYRENPKTGWHFEVLTQVARPALGIDQNNAHTQPNGEYHYHGLPVGLLNRLLEERSRRGESAGMTLLGFAADGFPIYAPSGYRDSMDPQSPLIALRSSYALKSGARPAGGPGGNHQDYGGVFCQDFEYRPGTGELDECNGRYGVTPEFPRGTYYYVLTYDFPYIPRYWRGAPDNSFFHGAAPNADGSLPTTPAEPTTSGSLPQKLWALFP